MSTIYSKISVNRKKEYQIETRVIKDKDSIYVLKKGIYSDSHVNMMLDTYNKLHAIYGDMICKCYKTNDGVCFNFIDGIELDELFSNGQAKEALTYFKEIIDEQANLCDFYITGEFKKVFGDIVYQGKALKLANIDLCFSNIIIKENKPYIIDYEWVFDFPVPRDYIIYRALMEYDNHHPNKINVGELMTKLNAKYDEAFSKMSEAFSMFVEEKQISDEHIKKTHYIFNALDEASESYNKLKCENDKLKDENEKLSQSLADVKNELANVVLENNKNKEALEDSKQQANEAIAEVNHIKSSGMYKAALKYYKVRDFFFPPNSKRKLFIKLLGKAIRHPIWFLKHMTPSNIKKFKKYSKSEGADRVLERVDVYKENNTVCEFDKNLDLFNMGKRDTYPVLEFEYFDKPLVSIIIPVYNQFSYTYGCLESIYKNSKDISYEVIIADDCSTDETKDLTSYAKNVCIARNSINQRFLLNCKNGAKVARGKYLLFLNNDTNVQPNWLSSLIETIESDEKIGMVGSKLVYPNGKLQEAGGILWNDGSAWNYGNKSDAQASEYNYRKNVDYISGAAIMLSRKMWDMVGGFDEHFCPAYCEDSDLAFMIREHGFEVVYDPFSVVVHYEGVSNGTDVTQGVKKYQVENSKKFYEKWKDILSKHYPNAENVFIARDRSYEKKTILMIDHYVPQYDKDAGSRTVFNYLKMLTQMGYNVKFIGENFYRHEPYTKELQKLGIEVLYGPYYANHYRDWLDQNGKYFDYVFFNRPHITAKFIDDVIKYCPNAKYIYYGHDLHYVRVNREYELKGDEALLKEANMWRKMEYDIFNKVDLVCYPSILEIEEIKKQMPNLNAFVLQPYIFYNLEKITYKPEEREGILFVGGFRHAPNFDGIMWFIKDIFPSIIKENPSIILTVVGSYPPKELVDMQSKNINIKGFVSDEELNDLYSKTKLVVVPLRYGAGIKGKVIEAIANQVPVMTTKCGAEGINTDSIIIDEEFNDLVKLYSDDEKLVSLANKEYEYICLNYTDTSAKKTLKNELEALTK